VKYAIIECGSKQYKVSEGDVIGVEKLAGDKKEINIEVLMGVDGENVKIGQPVVAGASVTAEILGDEKAKKIRGLRYLKWEGQRKRYGHRQEHTKLKIAKISL
jgi:large subunit ribosomal protein L21